MMEEWGNFFVAMAGASVAFAGLVLVSVSINLKQILKQPGLISRAGKPLVVLFTLFVASSIMLIPDQRRSFYGIELMLLAVNINLVAFSTHIGDLVGQVFALLVLTVAAGEAAIGLAILVVFYRNRGSIAVEDINMMKG